MVITVGLSLENVDFSRIFFSCVFNTLPIHQLIIIARATRSSRTPKKKAPVVLVGNRERRDAKGGRVVVVSLLFVSLSASLRPPFFRFVSREGGENWKTKDAVVVVVPGDFDARKENTPSCAHGLAHRDSGVFFHDRTRAR